MPDINRRQYLKGATIAAAGLAGCMGDGGGDGDGDATPTSTDEPFLVGILSPEPHPQAVNKEQGLELAAQEISAGDGILGREVEIKKGVTELTPETAASEARRLVENENVDFLIGPFTSESTLAVQQQITADTGILHFGTGAASPQITIRVSEQYERHKNHFGNVLRAPDVFQSLSNNYMEAVLPQTGLDSIVAIAEDLTWTKGHADAIREGVGDDIDVSEIRFPHDTTDFSPIWNQAVDTGASLAMMAFTVGDNTAMLRQWAESQIPLAVMGVVPTVTNASFPESVGPDNAVSIGGGEAASRAPKTDKTIPFFDTYTEEFGEPPATLSWYAYDSLYILQEAAQQANSLDVDDLVPVLEEETFERTIGVVDFHGPDGKYPHAPKLGVEDGLHWTSTQWQRIDGEVKRVMIAPKAWADFDGEQEFVLPSWMQ